MVIVLERRQTGKPRAWLWAIFNLAPSSGNIPANIPKIAQLDGGARQARNVYGKASYTGPCDPHGKVPYAIRLFALNVPLGVAAGADRDDLVRAMNGHIVDAADYDFVHFFRP
jgi:Raf kinase inhibitor-like YbhB/YbcL family protein